MLELRIYICGLFYFLSFVLGVYVDRGLTFLHVTSCPMNYCQWNTFTLQCEDRPSFHRSVLQRSLRAMRGDLLLVYLVIFESRWSKGYLFNSHLFPGTTASADVLDKNITVVLSWFALRFNSFQRGGVFHSPI